jgi:hypothetical protein
LSGKDRPMDMSFARRRKATFRTPSPDLPSLLAQLGARQSASHTARIQSRVTIEPPVEAADPLVEIFAPVGVNPAGTRRFSDIAVTPVTDRQSR